MPGTRWSAGNAMQRNHTICGLADAMIVVEAGATGGSIAAGRACLAMNKPLFAADYDGLPRAAEGNRLLISQGAVPLRRERELDRAAIGPVVGAVRRVHSVTTAEVAAPDGQLSMLGR